MNNLTDITESLREQLPDLRTRFGIDELGVFGSYVRGEQTEESDLDVLVTFSRTPTLIGLSALKHHLEDTLNMKVDVVLRDSMKQYVAPYILQEVQYL